MNCPKDGTLLESVKVADIELDKCHRCDGLWFDHGELQRVRQLNVSDIEQQIEADYGDPKFVPQVPQGYMRCPRCNGRLQRRYFAGHTAVEVDTCESCHGVWLDDGELSATTHKRRTVEENISEGRLTALLRSVARAVGM
ncbi:MAG: zf-TFIIB domain-containing protein [Planctomycetales bacterium]|nr:zf-TFIIB domain-containing protein [Planctomycetales bacterium]